MAQLLTIAITLILILLLSTGLIGPARLRHFVRKVNTWYWRDGQVFFPIDPYKPLGQALRDGWRNFLPDRQRLRNARLLLTISLGLVSLFLLLSLVLVVILR